MATFTPTKQQTDVANFFEATFGPDYAGKLTSIFLNAVAGAGKTSTIMLMIEILMKIEKELGRALVACNLSFNTNIRDASKVKMTAMGSTVEAKTTNQLGRGILVGAAKDGMCAAPQGRADDKKYRTLAEEQLQDWKYNKLYFENFKEYNRAVTSVKELVDAVRATQLEPTEDNLIDIITHYHLEDKIDITAPYWSLVAAAVGVVLRKGISAYNRGCTVEIDGDKEVYKKGWHDFNDQICLPLYLDLASPAWDVIFIDEAQDLNVARRMMITRSIKPNGTLFFVGDPDQSIQGFTFSDTDSVGNIIEHTGAVQFPLSVCWRCDSDIIRLAQVLVPRIQARPNAPKGIVDILSPGKFIETLEPGYKRGSEEKDPDLALCRVKKDLVENCLACIRAGKPAIVRGREIGRGITSLLDDVIAKHPAPVANLYRSIQEYADNKVSKLLKKKNAEQAISDFMDNVDTLAALVGGFLEDENNQHASIDDLKIYIAAKFADDDTVEQANADRIKPIVFSTIHKAKGLEYDRVFILSPELLPHPLSKGGWQEKQERNIIYVAVTRAKKALYFVGGVPALLADKYQEIKAEEQAALDASAAIAEAEKIVTEAAAPAEAEEQAAIEEKLAAGRKAKLAEDKEKKIEAFFDPSVRDCLKDYFKMLLEADQETREEKVPASKDKKLKEADVVEAAVIAFMGEYFTTSEHYQQFLDRKERQQQAREEYKQRKNKRRGKKAAAAPAPAITDQDEGPEDDGGPDGNGGGQPAPAGVDWEHDGDVVMTLFEDNLGIPRSEHTDWHALEVIEGIAASTPDNDQPGPADGPYVFDEIVDLDQDGGVSYGTPPLFDLPAEEPIERPVRRMFFQCLSKRCKSPRWATDYYVINEGKYNEQMYRSDGGKVIYAVNDFVKCPDCGNDGAFIKKSILQGEISHKRPCDARCWNATSDKCKCPCGGLRHGLGEPGKEAPIKFIGTPLLKMPL